MKPMQKRKIVQNLVDQSGPSDAKKAQINKFTGDGPRKIADGTTVMDAVKGANPILAGYRAIKAVNNNILKPAMSSTGRALRKIVSKIK